MTRTGTMDAVTVTTANNRLIDRKIKSLENELERQLQAVNDTFARNKELRGRIDGLRRERAVQDALYTEMARELRRNTVLIKRGGEVRALPRRIARAGAGRRSLQRGSLAGSGPPRVPRQLRPLRAGRPRGALAQGGGVVRAADAEAAGGGLAAITPCDAGGLALTRAFAATAGAIRWQAGAGHHAAGGARRGRERVGRGRERGRRLLARP